MTQQKRERELHPRRSLGQPSPKLPQCTLPLPEAPLKPKNSASSVPVREDTPWPGTGKMLGNLFKDRNWLLLKDYLVSENRKEDTNVASARPPLKEEPKVEEQVTSPKAENVVGAQIVLSESLKGRKKKVSSSRSHHQMSQGLKPKDLIP